ncbi:unnamed protein product [Phytomonas sp. Hart1]|nr:unnamed protein product [Phytomonas sp. Hart1]|eukprot:CCW66271.1 unnamed protein product [Phytomonas sp. isolate Hart1]
MNYQVKLESLRIETMMSGLREECFNLCCTNLSQNELTRDEVNCIDRCSWRYLHTHKIINDAVKRGMQGEKNNTF